MLNEDFNLRGKGTSNAEQTVNKARHRWYYYKEGFSPELVKTAVKDKSLNKDNLIIDPFNGSGTVTLTSANLGIPSVGYEVNPFTSFLAKVKTHTPSLKVLKEDIEKTKEALQNEKLPSYLEGYSTFTRHNKPKGKRKHKWLFNTRVIRTFNAGFDIHKSENTQTSQLMKLALIAAAMDNCNAKKDGKCLRYKNNWKDLGYGKVSFIESFDEITEQFLEDIEEPINSVPIIVTGDSRERLVDLDQKFDLCITSPPYLNTFDYTDIYRPELFLGEFITTSEELYKLRFKTVRSHIQVKWDRPSEEYFGTLFNDVYKKIKNNKEALMSSEILPMLSAYFEDLKQILMSLRNQAKKNASLWFVVGTSAYANQQVPVDLILADIATSVGWSLREIGVLRKIKKRKTKHSPDITELRESVVILDAN